MHCNLSDNYVNNASNTSGFARIQEEALEDIRVTFNFPATFGVTTEQLSSVRYNPDPEHQADFFIRDVRTQGGFFLNHPQRVFVLGHRNWCANPQLTGSQIIRGRYLYLPAAILLHENGDSKNSWCRKTLIHETLHSVSLYSRIWDRFPNVIRLHRTLIEGITECLVGYILLHRHPDCYQGWKTNQLDRCSISYRDNVKLWCSFCQWVGIRGLAEFYLSSQGNPTDIWNQFVQSVQSRGYSNFNYQLDFTRSFKEPEFRQICVETFPDFREIYESLTKSLDFSRIP